MCALAVVLAGRSNPVPLGHVLQGALSSMHTQPAAVAVQLVAALLVMAAVVMALPVPSQQVLHNLAMPVVLTLLLYSLTLLTQHLTLIPRVPQRLLLLSPLRQPVAQLIRLVSRLWSLPRVSR